MKILKIKEFLLLATQDLKGFGYTNIALHLELKYMDIQKR